MMALGPKELKGFGNYLTDKKLYANVQNKC